MKKIISALLSVTLIMAMFTFTSCFGKSELKQFQDAMEKTNRLTSYHAIISYDMDVEVEGEEISIPMEYTIKVQDTSPENYKALMNATISYGGTNIGVKSIVQDGYVYIKSGNETMKMDYEEALENDMIESSDMYSLIGDFSDVPITEYEIEDDVAGKKISFKIASADVEKYYKQFTDEITSSLEESGLSDDFNVGDLEVEVVITEDGYVYSYAIELGMDFEIPAGSRTVTANCYVEAEMKLINPGDQVDVIIPSDMSNYRNYPEIDASDLYIQ